MKLDKKLYQAMNEQVQKEIASGYLYLSMASQCEAWGLDGFATWMKSQYEEELFHAMKLFNYIHERGEKVELLAIEQPKAKWNSVLEIFKESLEHEEFVSDSIYKLMDIAHEVKDYAAITFLDWYTAEQVEEEDTFGGIIDQLEFAGESKQAILLLNAQFRTRQPELDEE